MRENKDVQPEFKAKVWKIGNTHVVTVPSWIRQLWKIQDNEEIWIQIKNAVGAIRYRIRKSYGIS